MATRWRCRAEMAKLHWLHLRSISRTKNQHWSYCILNFSIQTHSSCSSQRSCKIAATLCNEPTFIFISNNSSRRTCSGGNKTRQIWNICRRAPVKAPFYFLKQENHSGKPPIASSYCHFSKHARQKVQIKGKARRPLQTWVGEASVSSGLRSISMSIWILHRTHECQCENVKRAWGRIWRKKDVKWMKKPEVMWLAAKTRSVLSSHWQRSASKSHNKHRVEPSKLHLLQGCCFLDQKATFTKWCVN